LGKKKTKRRKRGTKRYKGKAKGKGKWPMKGEAIGGNNVNVEKWRTPWKVYKNGSQPRTAVI
jgi:hypothetical protein